MHNHPHQMCTLPPGMEQRIAEVIEALPLVWPFNMHSFVAAISRKRDKPIHLMRGALSGVLPTGMLFRTESADYILVIRGINEGHAKHIQFHELGHILIEDAGLTGPGCHRPGDPDRSELDELIVEEFAHQLTAVIVRHIVTPRRPRRTRAQLHLHAGFAARADLADSDA
jgi:hypothetical protein